MAKLEHLPSQQKFRKLPPRSFVPRYVILDDGTEVHSGSWDWPYPLTPWENKKLSLGQQVETLTKWEAQQKLYQAAWKLEDVIYKSEVRKRERVNKQAAYFSKAISRLRRLQRFLGSLITYCTPKRHIYLESYFNEPWAFPELPHHWIVPTMTITANQLIKSLYEDVYKPVLDGRLKIERARVAIQAMQQICHVAELQLAYEARRTVGRDIQIEVLENR